MAYETGFYNRGEYQPQDLIAGDFPLKTESLLIEAGQVLKRGSLLGKKPNGKWILSARENAKGEAIEDGSEIPTRVLAEDLDTSQGKDRLSIAYLTGSFRADAVTLGRGQTLDGVKDQLEIRSIYLQG